MAQFPERKDKVMQELASQQADRSRKGGLDAPIAALVDQVNSHPEFFTTSSCSGRITLFSEPQSSNASKIVPKKKKKGGDWLLISHELVDPENVVAAVREFVKTSNEELLVFRFEPFILALECSSVAAAQEIVGCAIASGFRESGITNISKRIIVAIRCSIRLEVPVAEKETVLVPEGYLRYLASMANKKMKLNKERCDRFLESFMCQFLPKVHVSSKIEVTFPEHFRLEDEDDDDEPAEDGYHNVCKSDISVCNSDLVDILEEESEMAHGPSNGVIEVKGRTSPPIENHFLQVSNGCNIRTSEPYDDHDVKEVPILRGEQLAVSELAELLLQRWGHSSCTFGTSVLVLGGYGAGDGGQSHARLDDVLMLTPENGFLESSKCQFSPRMAHTSSYVNGKVWTVGGRKGPHVVLDEVLVSEHVEGRVSYPKLSGSVFPPRHRHAAAVLGDRIYVFGGLGSTDILGDLYVLDTISLTWSSVSCKGVVPSPRHSHSLCAVGQKLYLYGGYDGTTIYRDVHVLDTNTNTWTMVETTGDLPGPRFSHSCTAVDDYLVVLGGCPTVKQTSGVYVLDTVDLSWIRMDIRLPNKCLLTRHSASLVGNSLVVVGGGAACYAFGTMFSPSFTIGLRECLSWLNQRRPVLNKSGMEGFRVHEGLGLGFDHEEEWALEFDREVAKLGKDALKRLGWLDSLRKPFVAPDGTKVVFPLMKAAAEIIQSGEFGMFKQKEDVEILRKCNGKLTTMDLSSSSKLSNPHCNLEKRISLILQEEGLSQTLLKELPKRWERVGDVGILPANSMLDSAWTSLGEILWKAVVDGLGVVRLARQAPVAANDTRDSRLQMLLGDDGWVEHRENGVTYCFDVTKCMYSSGNVTERTRMGRLNCEGEIVVDLFAGIGYFVLPFLLRARAAKVFACEWNPHALHALRWNLRVNKVEDRCTVFEGDNRATAPQGIANRVCLGLIPSSEGSWHVAVKALRPEGGILHVHENVKDKDEEQWMEYLLRRIQELATLEGRRWSLSIVHVERVKWYAPHIRHIVVDLGCKAIETS